MKRLSRSVGVRPGEGRVVARIGLLFGTVEAGRGLGEVGVDALVLNRLGPGALPYLFVALGVVGLMVALAFGAALGRARRDRLFPILLVGVATVLLVERVVGSGSPTAGYPVLWVSVYAAGMVLATALWTIAGGVYDARQAKRLFPLGTSAAILGGFVGMLAAGPLAALIGAENLIVLQAGLILAAAAVAGGLGEHLRRHVPPAAVAPAGPAVGSALGAGFRYTLASPLMRLVAVAYVLFSVLMFSVSFPFYRAMSDAFESEAALASALGLFSAAVTAASFLVSALLANRVYRAIGITGAALALPVVYLAGFAAWLVSFTLPTAVLVRFAQQVTQRGVSNAAWSAFFNVVPSERRGQVLAFMDGVPGQAGTALSGLLLLAAAALAPDQLFWIGLVAAAICTAVVVGARRRYGESLVRTLREGLAEQVLEGGPGIDSLGRDPRLLAELTTALSSASPGDRRLAAELLARLRARSAVPALATAARDADPGVRAAALSAIARIHPGPTHEAVREAVRAALRDDVPAVRTAAVDAAASCDPELLVEIAPHAAGDDDPAVRAELAVALVRAGEEDRPHRLLAALLDADAATDRRAGLDAVRRLGGHAPSPRITASLHDPSADVRAAAVLAVAAVNAGVDDVDGHLVAALHDPARVVRGAAASALRDRGTPVDRLLAVLDAGSEQARAAALSALDGRGAEVAPQLLRWAENEALRAVVLRRHALALARVDDRAGRSLAGAAFLRFLLERRGAGIEAQLLAALRVLGAREASGLIRRCLRSNVPETRAQAIEALEALGDRRLGRAMIELLELEPREESAALPELLHELIADPDPWVRALALRTLSEHLATERQAILTRAADDPVPLVRAVVAAGSENGGLGVPETGATLGEVERILFLRRVPLFAELAPEDLQRLAMVAAERYYPGGEALVREGELGDELVVIVDGTVRVVRREGDEERLLRVYGSGDHIGELAVLRERPRAATVLADEPGVRGLVIGGDGMKAILREHPEAAWAMLATLAERIGTQ